jgi:hypothetical protein
VQDDQADSLNIRRGRGAAASRARAFSLIDLLVSIAVVAVLIALLMPSLSGVREAARRVVCASNIRQVGLGLAMYADDHRGLLPYTKFASQSATQSMVILRDGADAWDGLGILYSTEYLDAAGVYYCPSHHGDHPYSEYAARWTDRSGSLVGNFQFRGVGSVNLNSFRDAQAMVADGMRVQSDYNHRVGSNVLRADLTVGWFADPGGSLATSLPQSEADPAAADKVDSAWQTLDSNNGRLNR